MTHPAQPSLGLMDIAVERNAYGRQIDSRIASIPMPEGGDLEAVFIRAPIIRRVGPEAACWRSMTAIRCGWSRAGTW